jgi:hypothetical protein
MAAKYAPESSKAANPPFDCTSHALSGRHGALAKYKPLLYALLYQNCVSALKLTLIWEQIRLHC